MTDISQMYINPPILLDHLSHFPADHMQLG